MLTDGFALAGYITAFAADCMADAAKYLKNISMAERYVTVPETDRKQHDVKPVFMYLLVDGSAKLYCIIPVNNPVKQIVRILNDTAAKYGAGCMAVLFGGAECIFHAAARKMYLHTADGSLEKVEWTIDEYQECCMDTEQAAEFIWKTYVGSRQANVSADDAMKNASRQKNG